MSEKFQHENPLMIIMNAGNKSVFIPGNVKNRDRSSASYNRRIGMTKRPPAVL